MAAPTTFMDRCQRVVERFPTIAPQLFQIRTEDAGFQPFNLNRVQQDYHQRQVAAGFAYRDNILKARREGFTTYHLLETLALCLFVPGFAGGIITYELGNAKKIFKIARWAYDRLPADIRKAHKLNEDRADSMEIGGSTLYVWTAGARSAARGELMHKFTADELAFWSYPEETLTSATEAVPHTGQISRSSTPNGRTNLFYDECDKARRGDSPYAFNFYPWWWREENHLDLEPGERIEPTEEEFDIMAIAAQDGFTLTPEHLKWRRWKLSELGDSFYQEHPEDPETCFLVSGSPIFDPKLLTRFLQEAMAAHVIEKVWTPGNGQRLVWRRPSGTDPYVISVDVAEGKAHGDWSVISTWQSQPDRLFNVARTKLRCTLDELASRIIEEAQHYNNALVAIERNNIGSEVVRKVHDAGYHNQFYMTDRDGEQTEHMGWHTNERSKRIMVEEFVGDTNSGNIVSYDPELWSEAMNVTRDDLGRPVFPKKKHDDLIVSACIANIAKDQVRRNSAAIVASYA